MSFLAKHNNQEKTFFVLLLARDQSARVQNELKSGLGQFLRYCETQSHGNRSKQLIRQDVVSLA